MNKIYKPEIVRETPVPITDPGYVGPMPDVAEKDWIPTTLESDVTIQRISYDLYKHASSGLRELYANEAKACRHAKKIGAEPRIEITLDKQERRVVIEGIDSMGMSWETFCNVYCVLGRSTNFDGRENGQFGFGRAAYLCLSDIMIVDVHSRKTGERYSFMAKSGKGYQSGLPTTYDMPHYGTRMVLTCHKSVNFEDLANMVRSMAKLSEVPTTILYQDGRRESVNLTTIHDMAIERKNHRMRFYYGEKSHIDIISVDTEDLKVSFVFELTSKNTARNLWRFATVWNGDAKAHLARVPIEYTYDGIYESLISGMYVNIYDERKYNPTPDRERLSEAAEKLVTEKIDAILTKKFQEILDKTNTIKSYMASPHKYLFEALQCEMQGCPLSLPDNARDLADIGFLWLYDMSGSKIHLRDLESVDDILVTFALNRDKVSSVDPMRVLRPEYPGENLEKFTKMGFQTLDDYIKEHGIGVTKVARLPDSLVVHHSCRLHRGGDTLLGKNSYRVGPNDIKPRTVVAGKKNFSAMVSLLRDFNTTYEVTRSIKGYSLNGIPEDEFLKNAANVGYPTSDGRCVGRDLIACPKDIILIPYRNNGLAELMKSEKKRFVTGNDDEMFALAAFLESQCIPYKIAGIKHMWKKLPEGRFDLCSYACIESYEFLGHNSHIDDVENFAIVLHGLNGIRDDNVRRLFMYSVENMAEIDNIEKRFNVLKTALAADARIQKEG